MKKRKILVLCVSILAILLLVGGYALMRLSAFVPEENLSETVNLPECQRISGVVGPEDFHYIAEANGLIVSSVDRRAAHDSEGKLFWLDLSQPADKQTAHPLESNYPEPFVPHGLTYQPLSSGGGTLFVISHPLQDGLQHTIEVFSLQVKAGTPQLDHLRTLKDELLASPNDLTVLSDGTLFVANDHLHLAGGYAGMLLDMVLGRTRAPLLYYDGKQFIDMQANTMSSAGITVVERDAEEWLYLGDYKDNVVLKYRIHRQPGEKVSVELMKRISLGSGPDNFTVDAQGMVYVTGHYAMGLLLKHQKDTAQISPTQAFRIAADDSIELLYANRGEEISCGSVVQIIGDRLLIGQIFDDGLLSCPL